MTREEITQTYGLNCDRCGSVFESPIAFPEPHICPKCSMIAGIVIQDGQGATFENCTFGGA